MDDAKEVRQIPIEDIIPNRFQPRINFDEKALNELSESIKQHGIIQPLVVRPLGDKFEIIAGERRYKAATMAGLATVPAIVTSMDDSTSAEVALIENVQRKDLTSIEEARSYKNMLDRGNMTQEELAKKMGLSQSTIANKLRLLNLDETVQDALMKEKISERHARALLSLSNKEDQKRWLERIINERLTVRQLDLAIKDELNEKKQIEAQDGDIPIVDINPDIESIINNAVDINPVDTKKDIDLFNAAPTSVEKKEENTQEAIINEEPKEEEISKPQNKFFNVLESESVNMTMEEKPKKETPTFVTSPNGVFNFTPEFKDESSNDNVGNETIVENNENQEVVDQSAANNNEQPQVENLPDEPIFDEQSVIDNSSENVVEINNNDSINNTNAQVEVQNIEQPQVENNQNMSQNQGFIFDEEPDILFDTDEEPGNVSVQEPVINVANNQQEPVQQVQNDFVAEPIPVMEGEGIVDPVTYYDALDPDFMQKVREAIGTDLKTAINSYRDLTTLLTEKGFRISIEEADGEQLYSILINVEKE